MHLDFYSRNQEEPIRDERIQFLRKIDSWRVLSYISGF